MLLNNLKQLRDVYDPIQPSVAFHIETSHLICLVNQLVGFYEMHHRAEIN